MPPIIWQRFNGMSDSKWSGIKDSFYRMVGVDIHSQPGSLTVHQKLTKHSGTTVTALCRVKISVSDGAKLWFSYTDGKIWRETGGTYTLVYTTSPAAGAAGCLGAAEYNGYIYWATQNRVFRTAVTDTTFASVSTNWATFTLGDTEFHPMAVANGSLFIGDAQQIAKVDSSGTFTEGGAIFTISAPHRVKVMKPFDIDMLVGTQVSRNVNECYFYRWDTIQTTWQFGGDPIQENGINAILWTGKTYLVQAGTFGNWYIFDGSGLDPYKRIPGTWSPSSYGEVFPDAVGMFFNRPIFGFSNGSGNPCDQGVYSLGSYSKDYPKVLSLDFPISEGVFSGLSIGAIIVDGTNLYVSWQNGSNFGIDKLDYTAKYASAYLESIVINVNPNESTDHNHFFADYQSLPSGTSVTFSTKATHAAAYTDQTTVDDSAIKQLYANNNVEGRTLQLKVAFTVSSNDAPVIEKIGISTAT